MLASRGGHLALCKSLVDAGHVAAAGPLEVRGVDGVATCEFNSVMVSAILYEILLMGNSNIKQAFIEY